MKQHVLVALSFSGLATLAVPAHSGPPNSFPNQYVAHFVCGLAPELGPQDEMVIPGNYATTISIHNLRGSTTVGALKVNLHYRSGTPEGQLPPALPNQEIALIRLRVMEIGCPDIWTVAGLTPGSFIKGMVYIGLPWQLPVVATYTSQTNFNGVPHRGAGLSIDVEYILSHGWIQYR